jgi:acyl carrier protein
MTDRLTSIFSDILNLPPDRLSDDTSPANTPSWDSLANMLLIAAIEETFEIELATAEIEVMGSIGKVRSILEQRNIRVAAE